MKKAYNTWILSVFSMTIIYGGISDNKLTVNSNTCKEILFCFNEYKNDLNFEFTNYFNDKNNFRFVSAELEYSIPLSLVTLEHKVKKELEKINKQENHLNSLLVRKRSQYQLHKVNIFGQLTNPVNMATNYHKSLPPRMEGLGVRLRF
ncbi:hypothetical protein [uncultured Aquimarina sp.]|uniref:hypothetical protein n=1 Tax=uncultured Aquimarina sp. TaxID=575652 RepID=UPI002611B006|nr:hypothetical protein [uncultured Aquimarina sp.]